jgi:hypothetical protein
MTWAADNAIAQGRTLWRFVEAIVRLLVGRRS